MATIDLGKIKLVWRGTYAGGTAYTVDDVVQHTDSGLTSSFICTTASTGNAPSTGGSVHGSWAYLAKGGTAGTDVGTTITTQGDLLYRDGSGLQRLAKGTAGQALKMNSSANAPEWGTGGGILQIISKSAGDEATFSATTYTGTSADEYTPLTLSITPTAADSVLRIDYSFRVHHRGDYNGTYFLTYNHSGISETSVESDQTYGATHQYDDGGNASSDMGNGIAGTIFLSLNTTNAVTIKHRFGSSSNSSGQGTAAQSFMNRTVSGNGSADSNAGVCTVAITEIAGGIITHTKGNNINGD